MTNCFCFFLLSEIKENAISKQTPVWQVYGIASIKISHHSSCSWGYILGKSNIVHQFSSVQFSHSLVSDSLGPHELQDAKYTCPSPTPRAHPNPCPWSWWHHPSILSSAIPFSSYHQSFPASGSFPMSHLFASGGQTTGVSASTSVLPMNIQDLFPLGWTGWISLQSKGLSRVFSNTTNQKHQFFSTQLSL